MMIHLKGRKPTPFIETVALATALHIRAYELRRGRWLKWHSENVGLFGYMSAYWKCLKWEMKSRLPLDLFK